MSKMASKFSFLHSFIFLIFIATAAATPSAIKDQALDVENLTASKYLALVQTIRDKLGKTRSKHVAVLPIFTQTNNPPMFDVILKTKTHQISVKVRADNLYVVGYKMQRPLKWLEFGFKKTTPTHLIPGSEFLEIGESYTSLEKKAGTSATNTTFTKDEFKAAVNDLAVTTDTRTRAKRLILMITVTAESTRFADISNRLADIFHGTRYTKLEPYMTEILVKKWEDYSTQVLRTEADPCYKFVGPIIQYGKNDTVDQLRNRFGLMYRDPITLRPPHLPCEVTAIRNNDIIPIEMVAQA